MFIPNRMVITKESATPTRTASITKAPGSSSDAPSSRQGGVEPLTRRQALGFGMASAIALATQGRSAIAQDTKSRATQIIVPFAPGGSGDITARLVGQYLAEKTGTAVAVEIKPGANGIIGVEAARLAPADGKTLLLATTSTHAANPSLYKKLPYDPEKDFQTVGVFGSGGSYLLVNPQAPYQNLPDFIAHAKARPGALNYGHFNASSQVPGVLLKSLGGLELVSVPYKTIGAAMNDLIAGILQVIFVDTAAGDAYVSSGRLRAIAVTRPKRWSRFPDLPALAEVWPEFSLTGFLGLAVPAGTPRGTMETLNGHINDAILSESIRAKLEAFGFSPVRMNLDECAQHIRAERRKWAQYISLAGIEPQ